MAEDEKGLNKFPKTIIAPAIKLIDTVSAALGKWYEPIHKKRMAKSGAYEINVISDALRKNADVIAVYDNTEVRAQLPENLQQLIERAHLRNISQETKKQYNIEKVVDKAIELLEAEKEVSTEPVDTDWTTRFFNYAGEVSNEEMQRIWSSILAGEVKKPGSFSLMTLDIVHKLSQSDAMLFQKILPFILSDQSGRYLLLTENNFIERYGITFGDIMVLEECGLIFLSETMWAYYDISDRRFNYIRNKNKLIKLTGKNSNITRIQLGVHVISRSGCELLKMLKKMLVWNSDENYLLNAADYIYSKYSGVIKPAAYNIVDEVHGTPIVDYSNPIKIWQ